MIDTPWDEPTANSPEFVRYADGTIYHEIPWNRIPELPLCLSELLLVFILS